MAIWKCNLCSHVYDEKREELKWTNLPDDWVCPICGSPESEFLLEKAIVVINQPEKDSPGFSTYECALCQEKYDESKEKTRWDDLPDDWHCPLCGSPKSVFKALKGIDSPIKQNTESPKVEAEYLAEWQRASDDIETQMHQIHKIAIEGRSIIEPMRARKLVFQWSDILIKGAQLFKFPLNKSQPVETRTVIAPNSKVPLVIDTPIIITHMSFGALSREAKLALAKGSAKAGTAMSSGEGGIVPESLAASYKYIFEYVPNKYSATDENFKRVDAIDIKIGQAAKPGMGGHLPAHKVTREIASIRGFHEGQDIISPSHFPDIQSKEDLKATVEMLREKSGGKPIGIKLAAGHLEEDIDIAIFAGIDFITIDGRAGGTAAAAKVVKDSTSIPTIFALARARKILDERDAKGISLIITGGLRLSSDFAKALAMGADAIAIGSAAMMAVGCQQYRICESGKCPLGIATQDPALRARLNVDKSSVRVANYLKVSTEELKDFARLSGNSNIHDLSMDDLCTTSSEISDNTDIKHV